MEKEERSWTIGKYFFAIKGVMIECDKCNSLIELDGQYGWDDDGEEVICPTCGEKLWVLPLEDLDDETFANSLVFVQDRPVDWDNQKKINKRLFSRD